MEEGGSEASVLWLDSLALTIGLLGGLRTLFRNKDLVSKMPHFGLLDSLMLWASSLNRSADMRQFNR